MKNKFTGFCLALVLIGTSAMAGTAHAQEAGFNGSNNWSGYVTTGGGYTQVSGTWTVPSVSAASGTQADAAWVGIGGVASSDLIQAGTQAIVQNGQVTYQAWYELLPQDAVNLPLTIAPGQSVSVSLSEMTPNTWYLSFKNNSTGELYTTVLTYASSHASAEWIEEMPSMGASFIPLDAFGTVNFSSASAVENGAFGTPRSFNASPLTMYNGGAAIATPSALGPDGASFSVARTNTALSSGTTQIIVPRVGRGYRRTGRGEGSAPQAVAQPAATTSVTIPVSTATIGPGQQFYAYNFRILRTLLRQMMAGRQVVYTYTIRF